MIKDSEVMQHQSPVLASRANYLVLARLEDGLPKKWEQLWAMDLGNDRFEICCIPFAVYDLHLGDIVQTDEHGVIEAVIERSGHLTFRVWFGAVSSGSELDDKREFVLRYVRGNPAYLVEWYSKDLLAIDAPNEDEAQELADFLLELENLGKLQFETGRT